MTIEEKILEWVAMASSVNQVTGVKLAEILTEMNDVIATVNANNQALVATNQQMQATLNTLSNDFPALQASLNAHINNANVHLSVLDKQKLSVFGYNPNLFNTRRFNPSDVQQVFECFSINSSNFQFVTKNFEAWIIPSGTDFRLTIFNNIRLQIAYISTGIFQKLKLYSQDFYNYEFEIIGATTMQEAIDSCYNTKIVFVSGDYF